MQQNSKTNTETVTAVSIYQKTKALGYLGIGKHAIYEYSKHGVSTTKDIRKSGKLKISI